MTLETFWSGPVNASCCASFSQYMALRYARVPPGSLLMKAPLRPSMSWLCFGTTHGAVRW